MVQNKPGVLDYTGMNRLIAKSLDRMNASDWNICKLKIDIGHYNGKDNSQNLSK